MCACILEDIKRRRTKMVNRRSFKSDVSFLEKNGSSLFCMGNSITLLSTEVDYRRGVLKAERP